MKRLAPLILCVCLAVLAADNPRPVQAAITDFDLTFAGFGSGGKVLTDLNSATNRAYAVALQADGKIVVAGEMNNAIVVARYHSNGTLDNTFGGGAGYMRTVFGASSRANAVAIQANGRIVLAGSSGGDWVLARYLGDGAIDTSFGGGTGSVTTDFGSTDDQARGVAVQNDGKIVAAGFTRAGGDYDFALARYCADGQLDNGANCAGGFGSGGKVTTGFGYEERAYALALQSDDKIVAAGETVGNPGAEFAVARYCPDGKLDNGSNCGGGGFDGDGKASTLITSQDSARALAIQNDGKIVLAGLTRPYQGTPDFGLARFCADGKLDNGSNCGAGGFGTGGKVKTHINGSDSGQANAVAVRPDGRIIAAGQASSVQGNLFVTVIYDGAGIATNIVSTDIGSGGDVAQALVLQPDGRAIVAGYGSNGNNDDFALIRQWHDGTLDAGGKQTLGFDDPLWGPGSNEQALAMATQADGKIVLAGQISDAGASDYDFALARFHPDGRPDTTFGTNGRVTYGFGGDQFARAVAIQPADGKIVVGGYTSSANGINFMLARFNPDGTPDGSFGFGGFNVLDFLGGTDYAVALTLAPDGKIVMAGPAFNGARTVFGVARFNTDGTPDLNFDGDGKTLYEFSVGPAHYASAVVVQPDKKIVLGGFVGGDFALVRLTEAGLVDYSFGTYPYGHTLTDLGGGDYLYALLLTPANTFVAAGYRVVGANADFALAQYDANGVLAVPGPHLHWDKLFVDFGGVDTAYALDYRADGQILAAGCTEGGGVVWAQVPSQSGIFSPLKGGADFVGSGECAYGAKFTGRNKLLTAGLQNFSGDINFALARFETTVDATLPPLRELFLPLVVR